MSALEQALGGSAIEVVAKATRRRFTVEYKQKIVREADACKTPGAVGALLRPEGLYSSHLTTWRRARERRIVRDRLLLLRAQVDDLLERQAG
jgi:transposase